MFFTHHPINPSTLNFMKCCSFLNPNYGCQVHLDAIVIKNLSSPQQCPNVHGEVRGQGGPGLIRVSVMCWEDGLCDDICSLFLPV